MLFQRLLINAMLALVSMPQGSFHVNASCFGQQSSDKIQQRIASNQLYKILKSCKLEDKEGSFKFWNHFQNNLSRFLNPSWPNDIICRVITFYMKIAENENYHNQELLTEEYAGWMTPEQVLVKTFFLIAKNAYKDLIHVKEMMERLEGIFSEKQHLNFFIFLFTRMGYGVSIDKYVDHRWWYITGLCYLNKISNRQFSCSKEDKLLTLEDLVKELINRYPPSQKLNIKDIDINQKIGKITFQLYMTDDVTKYLPKGAWVLKGKLPLLSHFGRLNIDRSSTFLFYRYIPWYNQPHLLPIDTQIKLVDDYEIALVTNMMLAAHKCKLPDVPKFILILYESKITIVKSQAVRDRLFRHLSDWTKRTSGAIKLDCNSFEGFFRFCGKKDLIDRFEHLEYEINQELGEFDPEQGGLCSWSQLLSLDDISLLFAWKKKEGFIEEIVERIQGICDGEALKKHDMSTLQIILLHMLHPKFSQLGYLMACYPSKFIPTTTSAMYIVIKEAFSTFDNKELFSPINSNAISKLAPMTKYDTGLESFLLRRVFKELIKIPNRHFLLAWKRYESSKKINIIEHIENPVRVDLLINTLKKIIKLYNKMSFATSMETLKISSNSICFSTNDIDFTKKDESDENGKDDI